LPCGSPIPPEQNQFTNASVTTKFISIQAKPWLEYLKLNKTITLLTSALCYFHLIQRMFSLACYHHLR
jgi:hypothetical protein